jgi:DNA-binding GntR family transcriptional regulator
MGPMPDPAYLRLAESLRDQIRSGAYPPGGELPSITQLVDSDEDVTRAIARDALSWLVERKWAQVEHGKRHTVSTLLPEPDADEIEAWLSWRQRMEDRVAELERQLADAPTREEVDELRAQVAQLQVALTKLYARTGHTYPAAAKPARKRTAAS